MTNADGLRKRFSLSTARVLLVLSTALAVLPGCRSRGTPQVAPGAPSASPPVGATAAVELTVEAKGKPWVTVRARGDALTVTTDDGSLVGLKRADGKRKFASAQGGPTLLEVKPRAADEPSAETEGFKLRGADGKLLWKVKVGADKIKLADDEDGAHAFVVSAKDPTSAEIAAPDGRKVGLVRLDAATKQIVGGDASGQERFRARSDLPAAFFGVLVVDAISLRDRGVIFAELATRAPAH